MLKVEYMSNICVFDSILQLVGSSHCESECMVQSLLKKKKNNSSDSIGIMVSKMVCGSITEKAHQIRGQFLYKNLKK